MSQSRGDTGQSMEEILASIRRIIAEGERDARDAGRGRAESGASAPSSIADTEVLILTEMVRDDGSIVSLHASDPEGDEERASAEASKPPEVPPVPAWLAPEGGAASTSAVAAPESVAEPAAAAAPSESSPPDSPVSPTPAEEPAVASASASAESVGAGPEPSELISKSAAETPSPTQPSEEKERISVPAEGYKKPDVVSEETLAASTAALAQLAQSVTRTRDTPPGSSKTVDEVVREAVEPMLKQWLDANLSRIVERMVREAIDRVVRRVE